MQQLQAIMANKKKMLEIGVESYSRKHFSAK